MFTRIRAQTEFRQGCSKVPEFKLSFHKDFHKYPGSDLASTRMLTSTWVQTQLPQGCSQVLKFKLRFHKEANKYLSSNSASTRIFTSTQFQIQLPQEFSQVPKFKFSFHKDVHKYSSSNSGSTSTWIQTQLPQGFSQVPEFKYLNSNAASTRIFTSTRVQIQLPILIWPYMLLGRKTTKTDVHNKPRSSSVSTRMFTRTRVQTQLQKMVFTSTWVPWHCVTFPLHRFQLTAPKLCTEKASCEKLINHTLPN